jgi:tRNA pseudouridine55 synthase
MAQKNLDRGANRPLFTGILNVAKPAGMTSHDVVNYVRRSVGQRKVGHAGTLDPAAEGVLLVCLGAATRVSSYLMDSTKEYRATVRFGLTSTTDDAEGVLTPRGPIDHLSLDQIEAALDRLRGPIEQVPPAYAAIKVGGQPIYRLARAGKPVEVAPRSVTVHRLDVVSWASPDLVLDVVCSKGTYVRALARDVGDYLGVGAFLQSLVRTASGRFRLTDSVTLPDVAAAADRGRLSQLLIPLEAAFDGWPRVFLAADEVARVRNGLPWHGEPADAAGEVCAFDAGQRRLVAILRRSEGEPTWRPDLVFAEVADDGAA